MPIYAAALTIHQTDAGIPKWGKKMTDKPSDMARQKLQAVTDDHDIFWEEYGQSVDDVERLHKHFQRKPTIDAHTAATLVLATIMNLEDIE